MGTKCQNHAPGQLLKGRMRSRISEVGHRLAAAALLTCLVFLAAVAQDSGLSRSETADPKFLELSALPERMRVTHTPNPVAAQAGGRSGFRYTWLYKTTVESLGGPIVIEEFGAFSFRDGEWRFATVTGEPFTPADFADWYACPNAIVKPGKPCSDPLNWTGNDWLVPEGERNLWYYIGRDSEGRRVKGQAEIELLAEIGL